MEILRDIRNEAESTLHCVESDNAEERDGGKGMNAVTESLLMLEVSVTDSGVMLSPAGHFNMLEPERSITRVEIPRMKD